MFAYRAKDVITVRILGRGAYPELSRWVLSVIPTVLIRERQRAGERRRHTYTEKEALGQWEIGAMWPQVKERLQPPEAGRGQKQILPQRLGR